MAGQAAPVAVVELNGKAAACEVTFAKTSTSTAAYTLTFPAEQVVISLRVTVGKDDVEIKATEIKESGAFKVKSIFFPGNALLSYDSRQPDAAIAACLATNTNDQFNSTFREKISPLAALAPSSDTGNYFFGSAGNLAIGLAGNNVVDIQRTAWKVEEANGVKTCTAWCPAWLYREIDSETTALPYARVIVTADRNGDGKATWQDAAIVYRASMPKPFGHEFVKSTVGENIAMNFASGAQQPFLKILDEVKKAALATDFLGQQVVIKGFSAEGHDSANTDYGGHYNERAGGLKDFTVLLNEARKYNARIGIHINASEVYPEAHRYNPDILRLDAKGNPKNGWIWLDQAHMIDKHKDCTTGQLYAALDRMRAELPKLDFVYVDTYWENGWVAWKIASKLNSLGLPMYSEGDCCLDPWITWGHWRGANHTIQRFLWYSDRDLFTNDAILRGGRSDNDGFLGWQGRHNFHSFIRNTFTAHLPAKYLQHFELQRWEPGKEAVFSGGVNVVKSGDNVVVTRDGREVMRWTGGGANTSVFVEWPPMPAAGSATKIYAWDDGGGEQTRQLPARWKDCREVYLYKLTDMGRTEEAKIPVTGGKVTLNLAKGVPYVLYPAKAPEQKLPEFGTGSVVEDPGFDSHGFRHWTPANPALAKIENDNNGNARLVLSGEAETTVSQTVDGLVGGKLYAFSVWAQASGSRAVGLEVQPLGANNAPAGKAAANFATITNVRHSAPNDSRTGSNYQRLRVLVDMPAGVTEARITLKAGDGKGIAEFDDIRVVATTRAPEAAKHFFWEDFENVETGGYGPFTCCPGERTHLSESHEPFTNDTISGKFSLKSRDGGCVGRTLPSSLRFKPLTEYRIACAVKGKGHLTATSRGKTVLNLKFPNLPDYKTSRIEGSFSTGKDSESFLSLFRDGGDFIAIDDIAIDEIGPATAESAALVPDTVIPDERLAGRAVLMEEKFASPLGKSWTITPSKLPGTSIEAKAGALEICAYAHTSIAAESALPDGATAVECRLTNDGDQGETWGPGLCLIWPTGQQLRVNIRSASGQFGVDSTVAPQQPGGKFTGNAAVLRIRLEEKEVVAEARADAGDGWQRIAAYPRGHFPGNPSRVRLGKSHGADVLDDNSDTGPIGTVNITLLRVYGK